MWIVGLVRMVDLVMKMLRSSIMNIAGNIDEPGDDVVSDAVKDHADSGELHTKNGIYWWCHGICTHMGQYTQYIYLGCTVQADRSWSDDARAREAPANTLQLNTITCIATMSTGGSCGECWAAVSLLPRGRRAPCCTWVSHAPPPSAPVEMVTGRRWAAWPRYMRTPGS